MYCEGADDVARDLVWGGWILSRDVCAATSRGLLQLEKLY